jgi:AraC-like DNA-binding protein
MLYFHPALVARSLPEDARGVPEIAHPVLRDPHLAHRFAALFAALTAPNPDALEAEEGVLRVLAQLFDLHGARPLSRPTPPAVSRALRRLTEAPERAPTLAELAALSGVSRFQLLRGFARTVGVTPHAYLVQQRVRLARRLLAKGRRPAAAAAEAGFADQSHMTRAFVRQLGVTPARYRAALA